MTTFFMRWSRVLGVIACGALIGDGLLSQRVARAQAMQPFTVSVEPPTLTLHPGDTAHALVHIQVPPHHYLYQSETELVFETLEGLRIGAVKYPSATPHADPFTGEMKQVFEQDVEIDAPIEVPSHFAGGHYALSATVSFQGCSEKLCYRREEELVSWDVEVSGAGVASPSPSGTGGEPVLPSPSVSNTATLLSSETPSPANSPTPGISGVLAPSPSDTSSRVVNPSSLFNLREWLQTPMHSLFAHGSAVTYALAFIGGVLTGFTPCVLPLIPVVLLIVGVDPKRRRRSVVIGAAHGLGLALTYAAIGVIGAGVGKPIGFLFQQRWFLVGAILFFLAMAFSMFGAFSLQLPSSWQLKLQRLGGKGPRGAMLAGIGTGLLATPCAGPVVAALVAHVSVQHDLTQGFALLFTYGAGLGTLFLIVAGLYAELARRLPKGGVVAWVKIFLGILLLLPALYYASVLWDGGTSTTISGISDSIPHDALWLTDEATALQRAKDQHLPMLIDFTAKTCVPCMIMERTTFQDPTVREALRTKIIPLKVDTTFLTPTIDALINKYHVVGWPTLLFTTSDGNPLQDLQFIGEVVSAPELLEHINRAQRSQP